MNFTREPIILSVVTPKEGCKLVVRNSNIDRQEDHFVDAVEVVSFDGAIFYRSLERPKSFLLPIASYEVLEVKETRMVLKSVSQEKAIKIGGGAKQTDDNKIDKSKDKKKSKRRKPTSNPIKVPEPTNKDQGGDAKIDETPQVSSSVLRKIFPPPNTLIKEKLERYKNEEFFEENILPVKEDAKVDKKAKDIKPLKEELQSPNQEKPETPKQEKVKQADPKPEVVEKKADEVPSKQENLEEKKESTSKDIEKKEDTKK